LISVWIRYTSIMSVLSVENRTTMFLNIVMLLLVAIEPYLFYLIGVYDYRTNPDLLNYSSAFYAINMAGLMASLAFLTHQLTIEERRPIPSEHVLKYKRVRDSLFISAALFLMTALPQFWEWRPMDMPARFYLWIAPMVLSWMMRVSGLSRKAPTSRQQQL